MDLFAIVEGHLRFIERFFSGAAGPFEEIKRKIEANEAPYIPRCEPGEYDGYEYEIEWTDAENSLRVLGHCALGLVEKALHDYLREFVMREAGFLQAEDLSPLMKGKGSWFQKLCSFLEREIRFDWSRSPVSLERIEQINLTRNDVIHNPAIESTSPEQSEMHFRKYPVSLFADELDLLALTGEDGNPVCPVTLHVSREKLMAAIDDVRQFCAFVEAQRTKW